MSARDFILDRFKLKTATTRGGLSPAVVRGNSVKSRKWSDAEIDAALTDLRKDGTLHYSDGKWWRR